MSFSSGVASVPATYTLTWVEFVALKSHWDERSRKQEKNNALAASAEFHLFPKLPPEIRFKIWRESLPGPRFVEMRFSHRPWTKQYDFVSTGDFNNGGSPTILRVCHEARTEALKSYSLAFHSPKVSVPVYFDFDKDILSIRGEGFTWSPEEIERTLQSLPDKDRVRRVAISTKSSLSGWGRSEDQRRVGYALKFPDLTELILLHTLPRGFCDHLGECKIGYSCFPKIQETAFFNGQPSDPSDVNKEMVSRLLNRLRHNAFGNIRWKKPALSYMGVCGNGLLRNGRYHRSCPSLTARKRAGLPKEKSCTKSTKHTK